MTTCGRFLAIPVLFFVLQPGPNRLPAQTADISKTRSIAEAQHEIVMIHMRKKEFAKAAEEANKIFQMKWPDDHEPLLLRELLALSAEFKRNGQLPAAIRLLETNMPVFKTPKSKAAIWKEKGYLLETLGDHDKALDCFREAQRLEVIKVSEVPAVKGKSKLPR